MGYIKTGFNRPWEIQFPCLTRYLAKEYTNAFFEEGKLRLSSFKSFRNNPDEQRGDPNEGRVVMQLQTPGARHSVVAMNGQEAYVLCATAVESKSNEKSFGTKHGFRIIDHLGFIETISRYIPGFVLGMEGLCHYRDALLITKRDEKPFTSIKIEDDPLGYSKAHDEYIREQSKDGYFIKHIDYAHQGEYRFMWFASGAAEKEHIDIVCPELNKFCQRLDNT